MDNVIVEGTGMVFRVATGVAVSDPMTPLGLRLEKAMLDAVNGAYADGITDPATIKVRIDAALETARAEE